MAPLPDDGGEPLPRFPQRNNQKTSACKHFLKMKKIQKNLWDFMQFTLQSADSDAEDNEENFYLMMVDKIYEEFLDLKNASLQI